MSLRFYQGKNILITGHTGFKGTWLSMILQLLGATVIGYSDGPLPDPSLYTLLPPCTQNEIMGDISDVDLLEETIRKYNIQYVFHLAAQSIVSAGVEQPFKTFKTNALGAAGILEAIRRCSCVDGVLFVTTDKVYWNNGNSQPFTEDDRLWGSSPYAASKCCAELIAETYYQTYWANTRKIGLAVVRAGNVIGGGDFANHRIIPDCVRAWEAQEPVVLRNPNAVRPYQHVLDVLFAYIEICQYVSTDGFCFQKYNVGPESEVLCTTQELAVKFQHHLNMSQESFDIATLRTFSEDSYLALNSDKLHRELNCRPMLTLDESIKKTAQWYKVWREKGDLYACCKSQVLEYISKKWGTEEWAIKLLN